MDVYLVVSEDKPVFVYYWLFMFQLGDRNVNIYLSGTYSLIWGWVEY